MKVPPKVVHLVETQVGMSVVQWVDELVVHWVVDWVGALELN